MTTRLTALARAIDLGSGRFFDPSVAEARDVLDRAGTRLELSLHHTVVALAGATGGGKSSLFNRLAGMDVARVGVRRPTTAQPLACVWGAQGAEKLLDWLEVPALGRLSKESALDPSASDDLDGLVLLDLPDHDSTELRHRQTVDRMVKLVDLFIWVMDPQKYSDAAIHERYLRPLSAHADVTVVVLNQVDRLAPADVEACLADLRRLLDEDGLSEARALPVSASTGDGVDALMDMLRQTVVSRRAASARIEADVRRTARHMARAARLAEPGELGPDERERLVDALAEAAGVDRFAAHVGEAYLRRRGDPVVRPGIDREAVAEAVRHAGAEAAGELAGGWGGSVRAVADEAAARMPVALDDALDRVDVRGDGRGVRWRLSGVVEWLGVTVGLAGGLWALAGQAADRLGAGVDVPEVRLIDTSLALMLLVVGGAVAVVTAAARQMVGRRARERRAAEVRATLRDAVAAAADAEVIRPVSEELERYREFRAALTAAAD